MAHETEKQPAPPPAAPAPAPAAPEPHLFDRLSVLYKYRWASIAVFVAVVGWVMVDSYTSIPMYQARARVLIEDPGSDIATPGDMARTPTVVDPEIYMQTQLRIMRGRELAQRVAEKLDVKHVPELNGQGPKPTPLAKSIAAVKYYATWPYRLVTSAAAPPVSVPSAPGEVSGDYADQLLGRQAATQVRGSQLVDIEFKSADPQFAARAANAFADEYVNENLRLKIESLEKAAEWLSGEVQRQANLVRESEQKIAQYTEKQDAGALNSGQNIVVQNLTAFNEALNRARQERIAKENIWKQVQDAGNDVDTLSVVLSAPAVQQLRTQVTQLQQEKAQVTERYGEKHPRYQQVITQLDNAQKQLQLEIRKAQQTAKNEYDAAVAQERGLTQQLNQSKAAATDLSRKGVDFAVLSREAESNRNVYNQLLTREKELRVVANSRTNNVRVVDRAEVPGAPFSPNHRRDWIYALAVGLAIGLAVAFGIDYLDDTVKTPDDITRRLKLRFLGLVPIVSGERHPLISGPVPHDFGEAYRSIRTSLAAQFPGTGARVVAVASSQPLEGKTTTAVNIAMALAVGGARVLLIDADMRRPSVHKALRMTNDRGLSQLLAGQARMREVVQRTHDPNLLTITAGRTPANPSELLASDRMRALLSGLETGPFDWIIIDTPPVLAVTDAVILAPLVGAVAFVIGAEMTRWRLAERAVETLLGSNPRAVLAVLNKVNFGRNKYYYSRYYGHQYKNYYAESPAA